LAYTVRERKSAFIHLNDTAKPGVVCGPFHAISYYIGCPYKCSYCYLQGTFRGNVEPVLYSNREKLLKELDEWLEQPGNFRLNAGELEDSLALDGKIPLVNDLVPRFAAQRRHKLLLVSKSTNVRNLLKHDPKGQVIVGFSVNAPEVWQQFEGGTPHPLRRARAAARVKAAGYYLTLRLDPMIPIHGWETAYPRFIDSVCGIVKPDQWTIGSLRYFTTLPHWTRQVGRSDKIYSYGQERSPEDGRKRISTAVRSEMYATAFKAIRRRQRKATIRLCKETAPLYESLGLDPDGCCYSVALKNGKH
jgi:spore photoproduct lyase